MKRKSIFITIMTLATLLLASVSSNAQAKDSYKHSHGDRSHTHANHAASHSHNSGQVSVKTHTKQKSDIAQKSDTTKPDHSHSTKVVYVQADPAYYNHSKFYFNNRHYGFNSFGFNRHKRVNRFRSFHGNRGFRTSKHHRGISKHHRSSRSKHHRSRSKFHRSSKSKFHRGSRSSRNRGSRGSRSRR